MLRILVYISSKVSRQLDRWTAELCPDYRSRPARYREKPARYWSRRSAVRPPNWMENRIGHEWLQSQWPRLLRQSYPRAGCDNDDVADGCRHRRTAANGRRPLPSGDGGAGHRGVPVRLPLNDGWPPHGDGSYAGKRWTDRRPGHLHAAA